MLRPRSLLSIAACVVFAAPTLRAHDWNGFVADKAGNLFAVDADWGVIWKVTPEGKSSVFVDDKRGAALNHPHHLEIDADDRLWLAGG